MSIKDMKTINLLNYNENVVVVSTKHDSYKIDPATKNNPTTLPLTLDEILYINSNSAAFKNGILRFPEDIEQEMYEEYLRIPNWRELLTIQDIENIILHPTMEGLTKLINIKDGDIFDRVRGVFVKLKNTTNNDISLRVEEIIKNRASELRRGIRNTAIIIKAKDTVSAVPTEEVDSLKRQNEDLQKQMADMQKMIERMLANQGADNMGKPLKDSSSLTTSKKVGRPRKSDS